MSHFLAIADETDSVVAEGSDLQAVVIAAAELGYTDGYVTNQDGGRGDLAELVERFTPAPKVDTEKAYRAVLAGWGDPMKEETWPEMVADLSRLAQEYGEDLQELVQRFATDEGR